MRAYITRKQHNKIFPLRKLSLFVRAEYVLKDNFLFIRYYETFLGKIFHILVFPVSYIIDGESFSELKASLRNKKTCCSDSVYIDHPVYKKFLTEAGIKN